MPSDPNSPFLSLSFRDIRGDLQLLKLGWQSNRVEHFSAWVDNRQLQPSLNIEPAVFPAAMKPSYLAAIVRQLFLTAAP